MEFAGRVTGVVFRGDVAQVIIEAEKSKIPEIAKLYEESKNGGCKCLKTIAITKHKDKRSLSANAYLWTLLDKVASKLQTSKLELYRGYVRDYGVFQQVQISQRAAQTWERLWTEKGLGWVIEQIGEQDGFKIFNAYYGTSVYNKAQMKRIIDAVVEDARDLDIETKTPLEIAELISLMEGK